MLHFGLRLYFGKKTMVTKAACKDPVKHIYLFQRKVDGEDNKRLRENVFSTR